MIFGGFWPTTRKKIFCQPVLTCGAERARQTTCYNKFSSKSLPRNSFWQDRQFLKRCETREPALFDYTNPRVYPAHDTITYIIWDLDSKNKLLKWRWQLPNECNTCSKIQDWSGIGQGLVRDWPGIGQRIGQGLARDWSGDWSGIDQGLARDWSGIGQRLH